MNRIEELRALEQSATPGPWEAVIGDNQREAWVLSGSGEALEVTPRPEDWNDAGLRDADAELITAMRNALPDLLAVVEAAQRWVPLGLNDDWEGHSDICAQARSEEYGEGDEAGVEFWLDTSEPCTCGLTAAREALARLQGDKE